MFKIIYQNYNPKTEMVSSVKTFHMKVSVHHCIAFMS